MKTKREHILFGAAVAVQLVMLAMVPAGKITAALSGKTVILKTAPVDPYNVMSGYYAALSYQISRPRRFRGWSEHKEGAAVYVVLKEGRGGIWRAKSFHASWPEDVPEGYVVIKGKKGRGGIVYGIESYYIPEGAREEVETALRGNRRGARVEVKVSHSGNAKIVRLLVGDKVYDY